MFIDKLRQKIDTLSAYSFFLPAETRIDFDSDLEKITEEMISDIENYIEAFRAPQNTVPAGLSSAGPIRPATFAAPENRPDVLEGISQAAQTQIFIARPVNEGPVSEAVPGIINERPREIFVLDLTSEEAEVRETPEAGENSIINQPAEPENFLAEGEITENSGPTLYSVTRILIPNITPGGKKYLDGKVISESDKENLRLINDKSSLAELFSLYSYNYLNFLEFLVIFQSLEARNLINFFKIEDSNKGAGRVNLLVFLTECNIIDSLELNQVIPEKINDKDKLISGLMLKYGSIRETIMKDALEIQAWLADLTDKSVYIEGIVHSENLDTNPENINHILDFIIPAFTAEARENFAKANSHNLEKLCAIIDGESSLLKIFEKNQLQFKNSRFELLKLIQKLDSQKLLTYRKSSGIKEWNAWAKFGELAINMGLVTTEQVDQTFVYRQKNPDRKLYIGKALVELNCLNQENLIHCLKIQQCCNLILIKVSYETAFINAVKEVIEDYFKLPTNFGKFTSVTYTRPLTNVICITYTFTGKLNGQVYYICDRNFVEKLTKILMANYGMVSDPKNVVALDQSIISELCNMLTGNSLTKLSKIGCFCETDLPKIDLSTEIMIAEGQPISILPLSNELGRFIIGFRLKENGII